MSILERRFRGRDEAKCCRYTVDDEIVKRRGEYDDSTIYSSNTIHTS